MSGDKVWTWYLWTPCCGRARKPTTGSSADMSRLYDEHLRYCPRAYVRGLRPDGPRPEHLGQAEAPAATGYTRDGTWVSDGGTWVSRSVIDVALPDELGTLDDEHTEPACDPTAAAGTSPAVRRAQQLADDRTDHLDGERIDDGQRS